ncbi:MAG: O-methyltransferase [Chloroflexaceae bacterium]|jgi:predicted O-methyltransferase YrrM|nr:O-methyltransferase [Chloroflexaceae bacterium]
MTQSQWTAVDDYFERTLALSDEALEAALQATRDAGMPPINVAPNQGKLLQVLALAQQATTILEIGTLAGYSTIWLARALPPGGRLVTLEADANHAEVARANLARAGVEHMVEVRLGKALDTLPQLAAEGLGPFDLIFIDADKVNLTAYFEWALRLARPGSLIIADNVVRNGAVVDAASTDPSVQGVRQFLATLAAEPRVSATAMQTVGSKGYDGLALAVVHS